MLELLLLDAQLRLHHRHHLAQLRRRLAALVAQPLLLQDRLGVGARRVGLGLELRQGLQLGGQLAQSRARVRLTLRL